MFSFVAVLRSELKLVGLAMLLLQFSSSSASPEDRSTPIVLNDMIPRSPIFIGRRSGESSRTIKSYIEELRKRVQDLPADVFLGRALDRLHMTENSAADNDWIYSAGDRPKSLIGKRRGNFIGKRHNFIGKRGRKNFIGKRAPDIVGERLRFVSVEPPVDSTESYEKTPIFIVGDNESLEKVKKIILNDDTTKDSEIPNASERALNQEDDRHDSSDSSMWKGLFPSDNL